MTRQHIAIITTTRADWGILRPVALSLSKLNNVKVSILAGNTHLDSRRGSTLNEIISDGFNPVILSGTCPSSTSPLAIARAMSAMTEQVAMQLDILKPDIVLILGDRYEILAAASAATAMTLPIAHIAGGEITVGAIDENYRHAVSKLSSLHFVTTDDHRRRLIAMGEQPERVINTGAPGVANVVNHIPMPKALLEESLGFKFNNLLLVTYHPETTDLVDPAKRFNSVLDALDQFNDYDILFTYPNNDAGGDRLIEMIEQYCQSHPNAHAVKSLGRERYHSILRYALAVIGNSSSGIVEVPSAGIPTVNIGNRQQGRPVAESVINTGYTPSEIKDAITIALSDTFRHRAANCVNPYYRPDTIETIVDALVNVDCSKLLPKHFYDIKPSDL